MNKVYISGLVAEQPTIHLDNEQPVHVEFQLQIRYKRTEGQWKTEQYTIHCWNRLAQWSAQHLNQGNLVSVEGRLIQRSGVTVAAREIIVGNPAKLEREDQNKAAN